jgi:hypothetical protein
MQECIPTRGCLSSVDARLNFGTNQIKEVVSVIVIWNDGAFQVLKGVKTNQKNYVGSK